MLESPKYPLTRPSDSADSALRMQAFVQVALLHLFPSITPIDRVTISYARLYREVEQVVGCLDLIESTSNCAAFPCQALVLVQEGCAAPFHSQEKRAQRLYEDRTA